MKTKMNGKASSMTGGILWGVGIGYAVMILLAMSLAIMIHVGYIAQENSGYGIMVILLLSSFLGAMSAKGKIKRRNMLVCIETGVVYFAALLLTTAMFFGREYEAVGETALLVLCGSVIAGMSSIPMRNTKKSKRIGKYYC